MTTPFDAVPEVPITVRSVPPGSYDLVNSPTPLWKMDTQPLDLSELHDLLELPGNEIGSRPMQNKG